MRVRNQPFLVVKRGGGGATNFVAKIVLPLLKLPGSRSELIKL